MYSVCLSTSLPEGRNLLCHLWSQNLSHRARFFLNTALCLFRLLSGRQVLVIFYPETTVLDCNNSTGMKTIADR